MAKFRIRIGTATTRGEDVIVVAKTPREALKKNGMPVHLWPRIVRGEIYTDGRGKMVRYLGKA